MAKMLTRLLILGSAAVVLQASRRRLGCQAPVIYLMHETLGSA